MTDKFIKLTNWLAKACGIFAAGCLFLSIVIITELVFERYLFKNAITWQTELVTMLLVASTFIGAAYVLSEKGHVNMEYLYNFLSKGRDKLWQILICGGGRKNSTLMERIKNRTTKNLIIQPIDLFGIDGDFIESQAFAYLAIRSYLGLSISFPETTGCNEPCTGGVLVKNF